MNNPKKLTQSEMSKKAAMMRARNEGSIIRAIFVNEVVPAIAQEFDRRLANREDLELEVPDALAFARAYVDEFFASNKGITA